MVQPKSHAVAMCVTGTSDFRTDAVYWGCSLTNNRRLVPDARVLLFKGRGPGPYVDAVKWALLKETADRCEDNWPDSVLFDNRGPYE